MGTNQAIMPDVLELPSLNLRVIEPLKPLCGVKLRREDEFGHFSVFAAASSQLLGETCGSGPTDTQLHLLLFLQVLHNRTARSRSV